MARPDVVVVTTVAPAHLEAFESVEGIAHEKASIIEGLQPGGVAILQADVVTSPILCAKAKAASGVKNPKIPSNPGSISRAAAIISNNPIAFQVLCDKALIEATSLDAISKFLYRRTAPIIQKRATIICRTQRMINMSPIFVAWKFQQV